MLPAGAAARATRPGARAVVRAGRAPVSLVDAGREDAEAGGERRVPARDADRHLRVIIKYT